MSGARVVRHKHLHRVRVELLLRSPLHIGTEGNLNLRAKECLHDRRNLRILVPSLPRMLDMLSRRNLLDAYEVFLRDDGRHSLWDFMTANGVPVNPIPDWVAYALSCGEDYNRINGLRPFIKTTDGMPYIPGSSIKGAMRTALIALRMNAEDKRRLMGEASTDRWGGSVAENVLRTLPQHTDRQLQAVNDVLRGVSVSDASPFRLEDLVVCQKLELDERGETMPTRLPLFRECVRPGARAVYDLTLDASLRASSMREEIWSALEAWDKLCAERYASFFHLDGANMADVRCQNGVPITLGGGVGFQSKSLLYAACATREEAARAASGVLSAQFRRTYRPGVNAKAAPYRYKAARYEGRLYPMGRCELVILDG